MPGYPKKDVAKIIVKKFKKGGKVELSPDAKKIPGELEKASKMHKGQAERLKKLGFKDGGEMKYGHGGDVKYAKGGEAKPDFLDMDKDGDKKESMKKAVQDKKAKKFKYGGMVKKIAKKLKDK
tara:strand:- start:26 stop:394 length:369 start_codon:yes stop_codon:yes gene_type:complete